MPLIKNITPVSYSSQDPKHTLSGLLKGSSSWLSAPDDKSGKITADLQLDRATAISYVDVGNLNSVMLSLEVRRSCGGPELPLLPTVVLMTPQQLRTGHASTKAVRMFKTEDLSQAAVCQKWDRIRLTCSQPFRKDLQFGLAFLRFYTNDAASLPVSSETPDVATSFSSAARAPAAANARLGDFTLEIGSQLASSIANSNNNIGSQKGYLNKSNAASDEDILNRLNNKKNKGNQPTRKVNVLAQAVKRFDSANLNLSTSVNKLQSSGVVEETASSSPPPTQNEASIATPDAAATGRQQFLARLNMNAKKSKTLPTSIRPLEAQRMQSGGSGTGSGGAPLQRQAATRMDSALDAARQQQTQFEYEGLEFLIALDLQLEQLYRLKVSDVRRQLESRRGSPLTPGERVVFKDLALDYCARRIQTLEQEAMTQFANGPNNNGVIDVESPDTVENRRGGSSRNDGTSQRGNGGMSIDLRARNSARNEIFHGNNNTSVAGQQEKSASKKFTFKRMPDSGSSTPLVNCSTGTGFAPSAKKAKFREENPIKPVSAAGVNRNRLAMCDSNASDFDNPVWNETQNSSKKQALSLVNQVSTPKNNKENKRRPRTPKNASIPVTPNTVGVWLSSTKKGSPASRSETIEKPRSYSFSNLDLQVEDPFSDDDVEAVNELDRLMSERSQQLNGHNQATTSNTAKRKGSPPPGMAGTKEAFTASPCSATPDTDGEGWLRVTRTINTPVRTTSPTRGRAFAHHQGSRTRTNRGSSTVVVLDGDDDGSSEASNRVSRTALTSSVVIGSLRGGGDDGNGERRHSLGGLGVAGFRLGAVPQNKFSTQSSGSCETQVIEDEDDDDDARGGGDQVECPICSGEHEEW